MRIRGQVARRRTGRRPHTPRPGIAGSTTLALTLAGVGLVTWIASGAGHQIELEAASAASPAAATVSIAAPMAAAPAPALAPEPTTTSTVAPTTTSTVAPPPSTTTTTPPPPPPTTTTVADPKPVPPVAPKVEDHKGAPSAAAPVRSVLEVAQAEVGGPEERYTTGWGFSSGFWCAKFVSWVLAHAGVDLREDGPADFRFEVAQVDVPVPGDLVFIDLIPDQSTGQPTHVAIVESANPDGSVVTIEGNADDSGQVTRQLRTPDEIIGYGRTPAPTSTTVIPAPEAGPEADCVWIEIGKPWLCDWES